jgi:hypothetical protein
MLRLLARSPVDRYSVANLVMVFQDRVFGALLFLFAIPNIVPLPPGSSSVLGAPLIVIACQLTIGRKVLWLPEWVRRKTVRTRDLGRLTRLIGPYLKWAERFLSPRLSFLFGPLGDRTIGVLCLLLSIILFLPVPLGNMLPAFAIVCFALALLEKDGIAAIVGLVIAVLSLVVIVTISGALWLGMKAFMQELLNLVS